jgi:ABC-type multidrug transport system fused ATPase/permease subunit
VHSGNEIVIHHAGFKWQRPDSTSKRQFQLKIDDLKFPKGKISIIAGPTGCGKTSLLLALLGEMIFEPLQADGYFVLPRAGGIALATQDPWVSAGTIRSNITFGCPFDLERYEAVLNACALETDIKLMPDGDMTEIGEKGINLSGGQKARLSLARCVYSNSEIILLDDVLSALDTYTSKSIVDKLFSSDLVQDRTIVMVTHHVQLLRQVAAFIVHLSSDGTVASQGDIESALKQDPELEKEFADDEKEIEEDNNYEKEANGQVDEKIQKAPAKLVLEEEKAVGRIQFKTLSIFFHALGGVTFWILWPLGCLLVELVYASAPLVLGQWANAYDAAKDPRDVSVGYWLGLYTFFVVGQAVVWNIVNVTFVFAGIKASRTLHERLVKAIFGTNLRFYDATPVGRYVIVFSVHAEALE